MKLKCNKNILSLSLWLSGSIIPQKCQLPGYCCNRWLQPLNNWFPFHSGWIEVLGSYIKPLKSETDPGSLWDACLRARSKKTNLSGPFKAVPSGAPKSQSCYLWTPEFYVPPWKNDCCSGLPPFFLTTCKCHNSYRSPDFPLCSHKLNGRGGGTDCGKLLQHKAKQASGILPSAGVRMEALLFLNFQPAWDK